MCNRFAMFPVHLLRAGLTLREQSVLLCLLSYRNGDGQAWPSRVVISRDTGIHIPHIYQAVKSLVQRGMITVNAQVGVRTVYTFPCLDAQPAETPEPAPAPVVAENATAADPASVAKPAPVPSPEPAPAQPTDDNLSRVAAPASQPVVAPAPVATPASTPEPVPEPVAKPQPEPQPAPAQPRAQQPVAAPVVAPVAAQEQKPAPMPALEPAPPTPRQNIVSARVARLPDVDEAVRREVDARPVVKSSGENEVDPELMERARKLAALCAENTARSREQKAAAQRFEDGVTAATEQVAKQRAAQDSARHPEPGTGRDVIPGNGQNVEQRPTQEQPAPAAEKTTNGQNADAARDAAAREGCYPADGKTNSPEPVAPDTAATAPIVLPAPVVVQEPQPPAATPQQGELLPAPAKQSRRVKSVAVQGELLPEEGSTRGRCLPQTWQLPREWGIWAMTELGFTEDEVRYQAKKFRDHWISTTRNPAKKNWFATWRNWMRGENEKKQRYNNRPQQQKSKMTQALDNLANTNFDWEHQETWNLFAPMTPEERAAAQKREEARAAAEIAKAARMREDAERNNGAE